MKSSASIIPIPVDAEVRPGDPLVGILCDAFRARGHEWHRNDVLVVAQKVVSKAEGRLVDLRKVAVTAKAKQWAQRFGKDERMVQVVLSQARRIVRMEHGVIIAETTAGLVCANCGVDRSNAPDQHAILLPKAPDESARRIRDGLLARTGFHIACLISDTFGRPWRRGQVDVCIGVAGLQPIDDHRGLTDRSGRPLKATRIAVADELAAAAGLVMTKADGIPAAVIRGLDFPKGDEGIEALVRSPERDLFR